MKAQEKAKKKREFLQMRVFESKSFDTISTELSVSKPTLILWERLLKKEIQILKASQFHCLLDEYRIGLQGRISRLLALNEKLFKEIEKRDFSNLNDASLIKLFIESQASLEKLIETNDREMFHFANVDQYLTED